MKHPVVISLILSVVLSLALVLCASVVDPTTINLIVPMLVILIPALFVLLLFVTRPILQRANAKKREAALNQAEQSVRRDRLALAEEYFNKATVYAGRQSNQPEDWQQAIDLLQEVVRLNPSHARAHMSLVMCYGGVMDFKSARHHYEILRQLDPTLANRTAESPMGEVILRGGSVIDVSPSLADDVIFVFFVRSTDRLAGKVFSTSSKDDWIEQAREKASLPHAEVILIQESEWEAPVLNSITAEALQGSYPIYRRAIQNKLRAYDVPATLLGSLTENIRVSANPLTGLVVFTIVCNKRP